MNPRLEKYLNYVVDDIYVNLRFREGAFNNVQVDFPNGGTWSVSQLSFPDYFPQAFFEEGSQWTTYLSHKYGVRPSESKIIWDKVVWMIKSSFSEYWNEP